MPKTLGQQAIEECLRELVSACRMPIKSGALTPIVKMFDRRFRELLDADDGPRVWARTGPLMRDNSRFLGTLAEFFANRNGKARVELEDLNAALQLVRDQCLAFRPPRGVSEPMIYCTEVPLATAAQKAFLKSLLKAG